MIQFTIPGQPTGKARPRVTKWGTHNTVKTVLYENLVKTLCPRQKIEGYIFADIVAYYQVPKGASKVKQAKMMDGTIRPTTKPDIDNICKIIFDALNGIAYDDDSQIVLLTAEKKYGEPRVEVTLEEVTE